MSQSLLQVQGLGISFGGLKAVQNVTLEVKEREIVGLIGPNGAGKTTFFNLVTGIYKPTTGHVAIVGKSTENLKSFEITNECFCARTFQNIRLFRDLTVMENVLVASHKRVDYGLLSVLLHSQKFQTKEMEIRARARKLLSIFKLDGKEDELACNLPYGDQRKLEIVRALSTEPKLLFLDEPAAGMNQQETAELLKLVKFVRDTFQIGILVIEHDMKFIMGVCERIYVLDHGMLIAEGNPEQIRKNPEVIKAYLGEEV